MTDAVLRKMARQPGAETLTSLDLSGWHGTLTDRGLSSIRQFPALRELQLCWQQHITDAGIAAALRECSGPLEIVNVMGTQAGDAVVRALAGRPALRRLSVGRNLTTDGIAALEEIPRFRKWQPRAKPVYDLMTFEPEPTHLLLDGAITRDGLERLTKLDGLFGVNFFWHIPELTPRMLAPLQRMAKLGYLGIDGKHCDDAMMGEIAKIPGLRMLQAQGTVATHLGFRRLSRSKTLEFIWGRECPGFDDKAMRALSKMPTLKGMAISCRNVTSKGLALLPKFPALTQLMPMDVPDEGFRYVGQCAKLERLWCMYCRDTGDAATEHLAGLRKLKHYYAGQTRITDRSMEILSKLKTLEKVELCPCPGVTEAGIAMLQRELPRLRELEANGATYLRK